MVQGGEPSIDGLLTHGLCMKSRRSPLCGQIPRPSSSLSLPSLELSDTKVYEP